MTLNLPKQTSAWNRAYLNWQRVTYLIVRDFCFVLLNTVPIHNVFGIFHDRSFRFASNFLNYARYGFAKDHVDMYICSKLMMLINVMLSHFYTDEAKGVTPNCGLSAPNLEGQKMNFYYQIMTSKNNSYFWVPQFLKHLTGVYHLHTQSTHQVQQASSCNEQ